MNRSLARRLAGSVAGLAVLLSIGAPTALAKEGVSVNLSAPLPADAQPGSIVPAFFTMEAISDDDASPLVGAKPFIRLHGPSGAATEAAGVEQKTPGLYRALIEIPAGGAARAEFGIHGQVRSPSGKVVATDPLWEYDGVLVVRMPPPVTTRVAPVAPVGGAQPAAQPAVVPAAVTPQPTASAVSTGLDPRPALVASLGILLTVAAGLVGRRRLHRSPA